VVRVSIAFFATILLGTLGSMVWMWRQPPHLRQAGPCAAALVALEKPPERPLPWHAEKPSWCDLQGMIASQERCDPDPRLQPFAKVLAQPPFQHFTCFRAASGPVMLSIEWIGADGEDHLYRARRFKAGKTMLDTRFRLATGCTMMLAYARGTTRGSMTIAALTCGAPPPAR
jgi:hypothetical protein